MAFEENLEKWLSRCSLFDRSRLSRSMSPFGVAAFAGVSFVVLLGFGRMARTAETDCVRDDEEGCVACEWNMLGVSVPTAVVDDQTR